MHKLIAPMALALLVAPVQAAPRHKTNAATGGRCSTLSATYRSDIDTASKYMAATDRELSGSDFGSGQANALSRAKIDIDLLKSSGCPIPAVTPSPDKYRYAAQMCAVQQFSGQYGGGAVPTRCDPQTWTDGSAR